MVAEESKGTMMAQLVVKIEAYDAVKRRKTSSSENDSLVKLPSDESPPPVDGTVFDPFPAQIQH